jgi:hypothetical protein
VLSSIRPVAEQMKPPRALHCEFPLGLPLGKPLDAAFQHEVLAAAFELLQRPAGPVLDDFPVTIESKGGAPLSCPLPPRHDPNLPAAVDEARALRGAYDRAVAARGRTSVGRAVDADAIPDALATFLKIAEGTPWKDAGLPALPMLVAHDIRAYYEELACELTDAPHEPWAAERWFYDETEAGRVLLEARRVMRNSEAPQPIWFYMAPGSRA